MPIARRKVKPSNEAIQTLKLTRLSMTLDCFVGNYISSSQCQIKTIKRIDNKKVLSKRVGRERSSLTGYLPLFALLHLNKNNLQYKQGKNVKH
jgi:hypothetical protein